MKPVLVAHIERVDLLRLSLAQERAARLIAEAQLAQFEAREVGRELKDRYGLQEGDSFNPLTGEITRKKEA